MPWEEKMKLAHDQGKLVLLQNLSPEYISAEVEVTSFPVCKVTSALFSFCCSVPGQALIVLKTRAAVDRVMEKLDQGCLMLPNERPLLARTEFSLKSFEKSNALFVGHLALDRARRQEQRQQKDAISTAHCSQNNTIEYEMAMPWRLLQSKSDRWWEELYERHGEELKKLTSDFQSKDIV